jgi:hypothetical protein
MKAEEIRDLLLRLVNTAIEIVKSEKEKGSIEPESEAFEHWEVSSFEYTDTICHIHKTASEITKPSWIYGIPTIIKIIEKTDEYLQLKEFLKTENIHEENVSVAIFRFLRFFILKYLENDSIPEALIHEQIDNIILDFYNKPIKSGAIVQITGIILHFDEIEIAHGFTLRKPRKEDFEIDIPMRAYRFFTSNTVDPTAYLEISLQTRMSNVIQEEIEKSITILRLFKPGSVEWNTYRTYSDSFSLSFQHTLSKSGNTHIALDNYIIEEYEMKNLKNFWRQLSSILPPHIYRSDLGKVDHISIAYNRYTDSLLQNGMIERRIANAIMGLEALYFKPSGESQELQYRLGIRVAKTLCKLNFDPIKIRCTIKDAYIIRSIFSHGGHLSYNSKKKYQSRYDGDIKNLLKLVLDYLRISIIVSMTIHSEKDELIDIIDNALIDDIFDKKLISVLNQAKNILDLDKEN